MTNLPLREERIPVESFFDLFPIDAIREQVRKAGKSAANASAVGRNLDDVKVIDSNQQISTTQVLSKAIGGISAVVAVISAILWFTRRNTRR